MRGALRDEIFNLDSSLNRDNGFKSWVLLRDSFLANNYSLHTADMNNGSNVAFELHIDAQEVVKGVPSYLLMLEPPQVWPENDVNACLPSYRIIFTWSDLVAGADNIVKVNFPNLLRPNVVDGFKDRNRFCCMIAGNKTLDSRDERILYAERVRAIRWFELNAPHDFDLYGVDWDMPALPAASYGKVLRYLWRRISLDRVFTPFPSYRGRVAHKKEILNKTRFSICYENVRDIPGYITEKIFDSFFSGCVPIYLGASNVSNYIPSNCFINRKDFASYDELYKYLKSITEVEFSDYQIRILNYLQSDEAYEFSAEAMARVITKKIIEDLDA